MLLKSLFATIWIVVQVTAKQSSSEPFSTWNAQKLQLWLEDHGVSVPKNVNVEQLKELVRENFDSIYDKWDTKDFRTWWVGKTGEWEHKDSRTKDDLVRGMRRVYEDNWDKWDDSDIKSWLQDHGIITPPKTTSAQLKSYMEALNPFSGSQDAQHPQHFFALRPSTSSVQDRLLNTWDDSQLADYLKKQGIQAGKTRSEMVAKVKQEWETSEKQRQSWGQQIDKSYYALADVIKKPWDFLSQKFDDGKDYVWSSWDDSTMRQWLNEHAPKELKPKSKDKKKDLVEKLKVVYNDQATNVYDTWSDSYLRKWLKAHGVAQSNTAKSRDALLDLMARNYYSARDTSFTFWSDSQLRRWLQSRGIVADDKTSSEKLKALVQDKYYELRDPTYASWDNSMLRSWLVDNGVIDDRNSLEKTRDEYLKLMKDNYYDADEYFWDTWSDAKQKAWLTKEGIIDGVNKAKNKATKTAAMTRDQMDTYFQDNYLTSSDTLQGIWKESDARQWLIDNGYMKSDTKAKKDELYEMLKKNYKVANKKSWEYYSWSDNRIRGWLRSHGVDVPMSSKRAELIQLMKENYVSTQGTLSNITNLINYYAHLGESAASTIYQKIQSAVGIVRHDL